MDLDYIESLAELLAGTRVTELTVRRGDRSVRLSRRPGARSAALPEASEAATELRPVSPSEPLELPLGPIHGTAVVPAETNGVCGEPEYDIIRAHRVGVFHRGESAGAEPLVRVGDWAAPRQQLACIESMCLFDEVDRHAGGVIVGVFVETGERVEYGQPLFHLERRESLPEPSSNGDLA